MYWKEEATRMLQEYVAAVGRAAQERGADGDAVAQRIHERLLSQIQHSGAEVATADLVRGVLAASGSPDAAVRAVVPPPLPVGKMAHKGTSPEEWMVPGQAAAPATRRKRNWLVIVLVCVGAVPLVLAVVGILAAIFLPALARARDAARRASCQNNLKELGVQCETYAETNRQRYPALGTGDLVFEKDFLAGVDPALFQCPADPEDSGQADPDYIYLGHSVRSQHDLEYMLRVWKNVGRDGERLIAQGGLVGQSGIIEPLSPTLGDKRNTPVLVESVDTHHPGGGNVLYLDGHVEYVEFGQKFPMTKAFFDAINEAR